MLARRRADPRARRWALRLKHPVIPPQSVASVNEASTFGQPDLNVPARLLEQSSSAGHWRPRSMRGCDCRMVSSSCAIRSYPVRVAPATPATNLLSALGLRNMCRSALTAGLAIACMRIGRLCHRYAKSQRQKSARSRDRRIARQPQQRSEKSKKRIVSAARSRISTTSAGPRSPSIIHPSSATSLCWTTTQ